MDEQDGPTPRRALPPRDEVPDTDDVLDGPDPAAHRRGAWSATSEPGGPAPATGGTPIPPPAVLPASEGAPARAGRRFSAMDLPDDEERPLPRRSALSPDATRAMSPRTPDPELDPAVGEAAQPRNRKRLVLGSIAAIAAVALLVAGIWWFAGENGPGGPRATPTPTIDPVATYLMQPADLAGVRPDTTWEAVTTATTLDAATPAPKCVTPVPELEAQPADTLVRTFSPTAGDAGGLLHQVETYATPEEATAAYAARVAQLGACERNTAWVQGGLDMEGLGDESTGATIVLQAGQPEYHSILVSRVGTRVNVVDATQATQAPEVAGLLAALNATFTRQCGDNGTCPSPSATIADGVPPAVEPFGFLAGVDVPRITAAAGEWRGTPVSTTVTAPGTRCEGVDLTQAPGASGAQQRTLLLQDDAAAPAGFGLDEVVYTFATPEEAAGFVATLAANFDSCAGRTATAEVARTGDLTGAGTGTAFVVTRQVDQAETRARFRVAVLAAGNHAIYLMANPTPEFDFADEPFHTVALRGAERLTQLP